MILAAGRGERMRPLTDRTPKPLLVAGGLPLIVHHLERLAEAGFREVVINLAHLGGQIRAALGSGGPWGLTIRYSEEPPGALETGGGILQALPLLGDGAFAVINGDVWTDFPLRRLRRAPDGLAHLVLVDNPPQHPGGDFALHGARVRTDGPVRYTYAGLAVIDPDLFAGCRPGRFPLAPLLRTAADADRVSGEHHPGRWLDVGTPGRLAALDALLAGR